MSFTWDLRLFSHYTDLYWKACRVDTKSCWVYTVSTATAQNWNVHTRIEAVDREGLVNQIPVFTSHPLNIYFRLSRFQSSLLHFYSRKGSLHKVWHKVAHDLSDMLRSILKFGAAQPRSVTVSGNEMCEQGPYLVQCEHGLSHGESPC